MVEDGEFQPVIAMADHFLVKKKKTGQIPEEEEGVDGFDQIRC